MFPPSTFGEIHRAHPKWVPWLDGSENSSCFFPKLSKLPYLKPKIGG